MSVLFEVKSTEIRGEIVLLYVLNERLINVHYSDKKRKHDYISPSEAVKKTIRNSPETVFLSISSHDDIHLIPDSLSYPNHIYVCHKLAYEPPR